MQVVFKRRDCLLARLAQVLSNHDYVARLARKSKTVEQNDEKAPLRLTDERSTRIPAFKRLLYIISTKRASHTDIFLFLSETPSKSYDNRLKHPFDLVITVMELSFSIFLPRTLYFLVPLSRPLNVLYAINRQRP